MKIIAKNAAVGTSIEDIVSKGGVLVLPTEARVHAIVSASANDDGTGTPGTGARTVEIEGVTESYKLEKETVFLNGVAAVNTTKKYRWLQMKVTTAGSGGKNAGIITATAATDDTVTCQIEAEKNISEQAIFMVPRDHSYKINYLNISVVNATGGAITTVNFLKKDDGGVWIPIFSVALDSTNPTFIDQFCDMLDLFGVGSMFKVEAVASAGSSAVNVNVSYDEYNG